MLAQHATAAPTSQLAAKIRSKQETVADTLQRLCATAKNFRVMPKWEQRLDGLARQPGLLDFGDIRQFELSDGRTGYIFGCNLYGNIVLVKTDKTATSAYKAYLPQVTEFWGTNVGYEPTVSKPFLDRVAAAYASVASKETMPWVWFAIDVKFVDLPESFQPVRMS